MPLDEFDQTLLALVQQNADQTLEELGEQVGLSGPAIQRRLKRHRESGLIRRTVAHLDPNKIGNHVIVLNLATLERDTGRSADALRKRLFRHPNVQQSYELTGSFDIATLIVARDMNEYRQIAHELFGRDDNVTRFASHVILDSIKTTLFLPLPAK